MPFLGRVTGVPASSSPGTPYFNFYSEFTCMRYFATILLLTLLGSPMIQAAVTYQDLGGEVLIENGIISVRISKSTAEVKSMKLGSQEYLGVSNARGYFQRNANGSFTTPSGGTFQLVRQSDDLVEISIRTDDLNVYPFIFETHYIVRDGESGFYNFIVLEYPDDATHLANLEQLNLTFRLNPDMFRVAQVKDDLWEEMPSVYEYNLGTQIADATQELLPNSPYALRRGDPVYTKYNMSVSFEDLPVYGTCSVGSGYGFWQVTPSHEFLNGTPTTIELTVHQTSTTPVCLRTVTGAHFGSGTVSFDAGDAGWTKVYGPWFMYLNKGNSREAMWEDAKAMGATHKTYWPYDWMSHEAYPVERPDVTGTLNVTTGESLDGALVFLAKNEDDDTPNWQKQSKDYTFWTHADENGNFTIPSVRLGDYSLYAAVDGLPGVYELEGISVDESTGAELDLGELYWSLDRYGKTVWQIGIPNRDSTEFLKGDDYRHWGVLWEPYREAFPDGVNYVIGESDWSTDWYFVHPSDSTESGTYSAGTWTIKFNLDEVPEGQCHLRLGIAGSRDASLAIFINDSFEPVVSQYLNNGQGAPRSGSRGYVEELIVPFSPSQLKVGENTFYVIQMKAKRFSNLHWDYLRLVFPDEGEPLTLDMENHKSDEFRLVWPTARDETYTVLRSTDLSDWTPDAEGQIQGTGSLMMRAIGGPAVIDGGEFFKIETGTTSQ